MSPTRLVAKKCMKKALYVYKAERAHLPLTPIPWGYTPPTASLYLSPLGKKSCINPWLSKEMGGATNTHNQSKTSDFIFTTT